MSRIGVLICVLVVATSVALAAPPANEPTQGDRVVEARQAQDNIDRTTEEMMRRLTELEIEYHKKKQPLFTLRNEVLRNVKGFWSRVIENHPSHETWFRGTDREALASLVDVQVKDLPDESDAHLLHHYRLELHFGPNAFFSNSVLWREVRGHAHDDGHSEVSGVTWFEGRTPADVSFFNFFERNDVRSSAPRLEPHYISEIGHVFRYEFWPNPFTYHDLPQYHELMQQHSTGDVYASEGDLAEDHEISRERVEAEEVPFEAVPDSEGDAIEEAVDETDGEAAGAALENVDDAQEDVKEAEKDGSISSSAPAATAE